MAWKIIVKCKECGYILREYSAHEKNYTGLYIRHRFCPKCGRILDFSGAKGVGVRRYE